MPQKEHLNLGRFIRVRERSDGTHRVFMSVPVHLRPTGWPASISIPELAPKRGSLDDLRFRARVLENAEVLNRRLDERRERDELGVIPDRSLPKLADIYTGRDVYQKLSDSRQYRNGRSIRKILEWSESRGHPLVAELSAMDVDDFLAIYARRPATRFDMRSVWNMLFKTAIYARWIAASPLEKGDWDTPEPEQVTVWQPEDVERYAAMARQMRQPGLAAMIITLMAVGQRVGDMRTARWGKEYFGDRFVLKQSKTKKVVNVPVPEGLRQVIESVRLPDSEYLFNDFDTGTGFDTASLRLRFNEVRHALTKEGEPLLYLRALRHSCVCRLFKAGLSTGEIAGITGHLLARVHTILERYFPDRFGLADSGMRRAFVAEGGDPAAFGEVKPMPAIDWLADQDRTSHYKRPEYTERNVERLLAAATGQHRRGAKLPLLAERLASNDPEPEAGAEAADGKPRAA